MRYWIGIVLALALSVAAGFGLEGVDLDAALVSALVALLLLALPFFLFGLTPISERLGPPLRKRPGLLLALALALVLPYLIYGAGTGAFSAGRLARLVGFVAVPTVLVLAGGRARKPGLWDVAAVLAIWLPFDFRWLEGIWTWPEGQGSYGYQALLAVDLGLLLFVAFRRIKGVGYVFRVSRRDVRVVLVEFLLFCAVAIPLGLSIEFLAFHARPFDTPGFAGSFLVILIFIAIPEELLFRGLIQNFLDTWWGRTWSALLAGSVIFGASHLNNGDAPNWSYFLMASVAGAFYGSTYRRSQSTFVAAILHALVDAVWRALFR